MLGEIREVKLKTLSLQKKFLVDECWIMAFGAAFQRVNVYKPKPRSLSDSKYEKVRTDFRNSVRNFIEKSLIPTYQRQVTEEQHLRSIQSLIDFTAKSKYHHQLTNERFNIGVAQKLLNIILKYYWCLEMIAMPPHFPVDRIIQERIKNHTILNWTTLDSIKDYMKIIAAANKCLNKGQTLAEWELEEYNRKK